MKWCQITILCLMVIGFLAMLHADINGREQKEPSGFAGVVGTIIVYAIAFALNLYAGTFSRLF